MNGVRTRIEVNGHCVDVPAGTSVAAAIARLGVPFRRSISGQTRMPFCGMGVCFECRVRIDGIAQQCACMVPVREGMQVSTDG
ncbi:MAG: (2Fe-2S)-binding protein [Dokdonella sp.]